MEGLVAASQASLSRIAGDFDLARFERMTELMAAADLIYVIGSKRAFPVTAYISLTLSQQGVRNVLVDNVGSTAFDQVGCVGPGDVVLAVSFSPYNSITPELVAAASERSAKIVSITDFDLQPAGQAQRRLDRGDRIGFRRLPLARGDARRRHGAGPGHRRAADAGGTGARRGLTPQSRGSESINSATAFRTGFKSKSGETVSPSNRSASGSTPNRARSRRG